MPDTIAGAEESSTIHVLIVSSNIIIIYIIMIFGIDFGTSNTVISINDNGVKIVDIVPTEIYYKNTIIRNFKSKDYEYIYLFISSLKNTVLKKFKNINTVISIPNMFDNNMINNIHSAFINNNINVIKIIKEPVAAITYHNMFNKFNKNIAVFDMGGGTTDITIANIEDDFIDIIKNYGYNDIGGNNFNHNIMKYYNTDFKTAELIKRKINICKNFNININNKQYYIDRKIYEKINNNTINHITKIINTIINYDIIMVGGGCKSYIINNLIKTKYNNNIMTCVSMGCCYYGMNMMNILPNRELVIMDMIPTDISIELDNGNKCIMIEADTIIPISNTKKFMVNNPLTI